MKRRSTGENPLDVIVMDGDVVSLFPIIAGGDGTDDDDKSKEKEKPDPPEGGGGKDDDEELDLDRAKEKIRKANSEAANLRKRLKEAEAAEAKLKEIEDSKKSDEEKAAEKTRSLEDSKSKAEIEVLKLRIALRKGLSETQAKRLVGNTEEELEADADELLESFGGNSDGDKTNDAPKNRSEKLRGGGSPNDPPEEMDPRKLAAGVSRN